LGGVLSEASFRKSTVSVISFHQDNTQLLDSDQGICVIQLIKFANFKEEDDIKIVGFHFPPLALLKLIIIM
jgi:hypothetical protein